MERYESLGPVGEGSYGTVLKCRHRDSGRLVAIKKFLDSDQDKTVKKIALREVKLLRQLRHDNLVNLLEVWKRRHRWYLVFEFVDRTLLEELEQNPNGLELSICRTYLFQVLRAVEFCHQQNVIHRDIKPENILISQDSVVKLCDFGFARTILSPTEGGVYTDYVATRWYRAPELLVGDIKYGKPVDVWALGCLVIEMLTGQPLFPGDSDLDQIFHIVKCFGDLMTHHQEVFYRNPVFSGVNLPECSSTISLQQRFPKIPPTALHLTQRCLEMDPEKRAQCSELLEHSLFTQDSFHIRFLDDLNAKIQKEHRENSTLPQITKTPRSDTNKGDEKNCRGKDKKQPEDTDERVNKDKIDKPKVKQPSKLSKTNRNTTESLVSTQPKTFGNKIIHNTTLYPTKAKPEKPTGAEIKNESEASKTTKTFISKSADETEAEVTLKKKNLTTTKSKQESVTHPEPRRDLPQNVKDMDCCGQDPKNMCFCKPDSSQEFPNSLSNPTMKVSNVAPAMLHDSKPYKTSPAAEFQFDIQEAASTSPKVLPKNQGPKPNTNILNSSSKTFPLHLSEQSSTETSSTHNTAVPKELSSLKVSKVEFTSRALSKDRELIDNRDFRSRHGYLNPVTEIPEGAVLLSQTSDGSFKSAAGQNTKVAKDDRFTLNLFGTAVLKVTDNSEKENQEDLASQSVPISSTTYQPVKPTLKASGNSGSSESNADSFKVPHPKQNPLKTHQLTRSSVIPKTQKPTLFPDAKKKSDRNGLTISRDSTFILTLDHKASTEGFKTNTSDLNALQSSTPPPPSPSNPLLLPPSSQPLMSSLSVFNNPAASDYLVQGAGFNPGTNSLRCVDHSGTYDRPTQQFAASKLTGSVPVLVSETSFISEMAKNKSHVHFPDIRSSMLPELREGKHNKGAIKNLRKDKNLVSSSPPSEEQQGHKTNTSTTKL